MSTGGRTRIRTVSLCVVVALAATVSGVVTQLVWLTLLGAGCSLLSLGALMGVLLAGRPAAARGGGPAGTPDRPSLLTRLAEISGVLSLLVAIVALFVS